MRFRSVVAVLAVVGLLASAANAETGTARDDALLAGKPSFGDEASPIRPGASIREPGTTSDDFCTLNYVFYNPKLASPPVYIGTAGHCTARLGQQIELSGGLDIGSVVYDSDKAGSAVDFSLIRLDPSMVSKTNPKVLGWGGPRGVVSTSALNVGDRLHMHGRGFVVGLNAATRSRAGVLASWTSTEYAADIPAVNGDSGAPLLHQPTGKALGIISRYGVFATPPSTDTGPLMSWIFAALDTAGYDDLVVATAS